MSKKSNDETLVRATVTISGRVQGVYFRASTKATADNLGITGWVRNLPDGSVKAVFEGPRDAVESIVSWCHQGPPKARVRHVKVEWGRHLGEFQSFDIIRP